MSFVLTDRGHKLLSVIVKIIIIIRYVITFDSFVFIIYKISITTYRLNI